jgi:hypothetical protein
MMAFALKMAKMRKMEDSKAEMKKLGAVDSF